MARRIIAGAGLSGGGDILSQDREIRVANLGVTTAMLADDSVTNAKLADMAQSTIKGRAEGAGTGDPQDLTPAQVRTVVELSDADTPTFDGLTSTDTIVSAAAEADYLAAYFQEANDGAGLGPYVRLDRESASPAFADGLGVLAFGGRNDAAEGIDYASWVAIIIDETDGSEDGRLFANVIAGGASTTYIFLQGGAGVAFPNAQTTASAANAFLDSGNENLLLRSTSTRRAKRDIADLAVDDAGKAVMSLQPVVYRSALPADDPNQDHLGLIAEDVAAIDPRLVQWGYHDDDYDERIEETPVIHKARRRGEDGKLETVEHRHIRRERKRTLKPGAVKSPVNVAYDRLSVLLLSVLQAQEARIAALEAKLP